MYGVFALFLHPLLVTVNRPTTIRLTKRKLLKREQTPSWAFTSSNIRINSNLGLIVIRSINSHKYHLLSDVTLTTWISRRLPFRSSERQSISDTSRWIYDCIYNIANCSCPLLLHEDWNVLWQSPFWRIMFRLSIFYSRSFVCFGVRSSLF